MMNFFPQVHTGEKPYQCDVCATYFTESGSLKVHKRLHSGEKPFKCDVCDVAFNGAGMLATHKRKHTGERPYMCDECGKTFRLLSTLKSHRRRHTGEKPFKCEVCGSSFAQRAAMQRHKRIHSDHKPWECEQCGYKFREKENLRKHVELHKIKLQHLCTVCGAGFNQAKKLETHKMLHNGGDRPYQCNKCPSTFTNPKYLTQHKKRVHDKKGTLRCEECNGTFKRKESLRSHMRIHMGVRPFVCPECGAAFNQRGSLTKHIRIHGDDVSSDFSNCNSVERKTSSDASFVKSGNNDVDGLAEHDLHSCTLCSDNFSTHKELIYHKRSNHPVQKSAQTTEQDDDSSEHIRDKYVCEDCDQAFFRKRQLKAHKKYCPCSCSTYQTESAEEVPTVVTSSLHNEPKEVDAMKLLTAALGVTGNDCSSEVSQHQHRQTHHIPHSPHNYHSPTPLSPKHYQCHSPLSPHHYTSPSLSPHQYTSPSPHITTPTTTSGKNEQHCQDLFTFTASNSSPHQIQYNLSRQDIDHLQLPLQQLMHLPHLCTQLQDNLHHPSDHLQQLMQQQNALKQLSEDNILKLAEEHSQQQQTSHHLQQLSYIQQMDHPTSRYYYSQSNDPPQEPPSQHHDPSHYLTQHSGDLQQSSRQCSDITDHVHQNSKHHILQESARTQKHITQTTRQQHIQTLSEQSSVVNCLSPSVQPTVLDTSQHPQSSNHHLPVDSLEEQQFFKDSSLSGQQHFPHHHQSLHLDHNLPQSTPGSEDCDDLTSTLHHHSHTQNHQLQEDLYQSEEDNQMEIKQHYHDHHHPLLTIHHSQHFKVEDPYDVTVKHELVSHTYS